MCVNEQQAVKTRSESELGRSSILSGGRRVEPHGRAQPAERQSDGNRLSGTSRHIEKRERLTEPSWPALLEPRLALLLAVLLGGVLLRSMNVLVTATLLPSIVADIGGTNLMSWPTTAFVASSIVATTGPAAVSKGPGTGGHSAAAPLFTLPAPFGVRWRRRSAS
jgi:hypothetical protein